MKRFLAMLLAVVLVVSMLPAAVVAETEQTTAQKHTKYDAQPSHAHVENDAHVCEHCVAAGAADTTPTWIPWGDDAAEKTQLPTVAGHYYITEDLKDMVTTDLSSSTADIVICLNGKTLTAKQGSATQRFYTLGTTVKVTILDCTAHEENGTYVAGKFTGATYSTFFFKYAKNTTATLTIYDGIITNSTKKESSGIKNGGAISMQGPCTLNLFGGEISNCRANNGGAIHVQNTASTVNIDGAVIKNNTAITAGSAIYCNQDTWTAEGNDNITIKNATITGNSSETAGAACLGAVYVGDTKQTGAVITLGGNNQIIGNTDKDGAAYDLYLQNKAGDQLKLVIQDLDSNSKIGVRVAEDRLAAADGLTLSTTLNANCAKNFVSNNDGYQVAYEGNVLLLEKSGPHTHKVCNGNAACEGCTHTDVTYEPWTDTTSLPSSGNYYLTEDVVIGAQASISSSLNLCLNGHTVSVKSGVNCRHFWLKDKANLKITNCRTTDGILTGANGASIMNQYGKAATVEAYHVVFKGNRYVGGSSGGGVIMMQGPTAVKLVNCKLLENQGVSGAVIRNHRPNSSVTLIGCEVKNNSADSISAIRLDDACTLTLIDTVITGNTAAKTGDESLGVIYAAKAGTTIKVGGQTQITGNTDGSNKEVNLFLSDNGNVVTVDSLSGTAKIGVTLQASRTSNVITAKLNGANPVAFFSADNAELTPILKDDVVTLGSAAQNQHKHKLCADSSCTDHGEEVFLPWDSDNTLPNSGCYYLTKDVNLSSAQGTNKNLTLCLNGFTITAAANTRPFSLDKGAVFTITDCQGSGQITGGNRNWGAGAVSVNAGSVFNLYGGNITGNKSLTGGGYGGAICVYGPNGTTPAGAFNMYGGKLTKNEGVLGGAIYGRSGAIINIQGGEISDNTATGWAGAIYLVDGTLTLKNCRITGNTANTGSAIRVEAGKGSVTLTDCIIENNKNKSTSKYNYGALFVPNNGCVVTVEGQTRITGNTNGNGEPANVYMQNKAGVQMVLTVGQAGLSGNALIGFTMESGRLSNTEGRTVTTKLSGKDVAAFFQYDTEGYEPVIENDVVILKEKSYHVHNLCNDSACTEHGAVTFQNWKTANALPDSGAYCLQTDVELASGAHIAADLKLCLNGHTVKFKDGSSISIYMKNGATLTVTDCQDTGKITGGTKNYGGMINVSLGSTFNLYSGTITGNKSVNLDNDKGKGGAVYLTKTDGTTPGGVFNMYGGTISENKAYRGGAVYLCDGSTFNMYGGTLAKNEATYRGGAITNDGKATINIFGGTITENKAKAAAAIYVCGGAQLTISGGEITKHTTKNVASVLLVESKGTKALMTGGTIANNTTTDNGTIYVSKNTIFEMTGGTIANNKAKNGAGLYINESTCHMKGGTIKNNETTGSGAGVFFLKPVDGHISGGNITGNRAQGYGAGVYVYDGATATISGGNISYNTAVKGAGGGACLMGGTLILKGGTIGYNQNLSKSSKGGGIMMYGGTLTMTGGHLVGNKVQDGVSGAAICTTGIDRTKNGVKVKTFSKINMYGGTISDHVGNYGGAVILQSQTTMNVYGGTFRNNEAKGDGGAVYLNGKSVFNMYGGSMIDNKAANRGGAICYFANTTGEITACNASGNSAGGYGGFLAAHGIGTKISLKDLTITGHESKSYGGAISITWNAAMDMENCEFYENKAVKGGAMYLAHKTVCNLTNVKVYKNTASEQGGAFYLDVGNNIHFTNVKVLDNQATGNGGGIYTRANLYLKDCLIDSNTSDGNGGGIATGGAFTYGNLPEHTAGYVGRGQGLVIDNTLVTNNSCVGSGGGVYMAKQNWNTITNSQFTGNTCGETGSALFVADDLTVKGGMTVTGNKSLTDGYAVYFNENSYDGQSHVLTIHEIGGNVIVKDNEGGEVMLCKDVSLAATTEGYGEDTYFTITLYDGLLTNWVLGAYNYEGGEQNYIVTYGTRSLDEPEVAPKAAEPETAPDGNVWLYAGVGLFAVAVIGVVVLLLAKKKKAGKPAETTQE